MAIHVSFWTPSTYYILWALWLISELFQLQNLFYANFCFKVFRMPRFFFLKKKTNFFQVKFFSHIQKIIFVFEIVHCAVFLLWSIYSGKGEGTLNEFRVHFFSININASNHIIFISVSFVQNINQIFQIPFNFFIAKLLIFQFRLVLKGFKIVSIKKLIHASSSFWISSIFK